MTSGQPEPVAGDSWSETGSAQDEVEEFLLRGQLGRGEQPEAGDVEADGSEGTDGADLHLGLAASIGELHQRDQDHDHGNDTPPASSLLRFADVPSQLSQLPFNVTAPSDSSDPSFNVSLNSDSSSTHSEKLQDPNPNPFISTKSIRTSLSTKIKSTPGSSPVSTPLSQLSAAALRKTSPGLAARLKALGFGSSKNSTNSASSPFDHIGRLDEEQLRELDEKHQAGSVRSVISRRGRPWKGASASSSPKAATDTELALPINFENCSPPRLLPEIEKSDPLDMDTNKYRLPDHTNGNGTKVTLDTRREHLERCTFPPSPDDYSVPPPPPPKDTPKSTTPANSTPPNDFIPGLNSYFTPGHTRPGSIYTLSRASFANQLAQLTSLQLPDAESLSSQVMAIPTAQVAARALINAADQIRSWIYKASEVIGGLDSEDDVEWAAAGGREGLAEVENAIVRFEELINAYVSAIEQLQGRDDIMNVPTDHLTRAVSQMEAIINEWSKIRETLQVVRGQVEIAMEWEELWNVVLGDIQGEMDELSKLVFEMEERRHKSLMAAANGEGVDIGDLETIVEETPPHATRLQAQNRFSLPAFPVSPNSPSGPSLSLDDSSLLALFARMQPLRASLDFLPMRLSMFKGKASQTFPTACDELETRHDGLDASYKKLEKDAESLRKELGEDRWVIVFRGAGRQAQKMHESVERSLLKLKEAIESGLHLTNQPAMTKKIESYEAKKTHYGTAIERVLLIIDKGFKDRLTVNGEILRLHTEMHNRWDALKEQMGDVDAMLEEIHTQKGQQLRDSISSMLSNDRSTLGSGHETPGSSPPSSVIMSGLGIDPHTPVSKSAKPRTSSMNSGITQPPNRRHSSLPTPAAQLSRKTGVSRLTAPTISSSSRTPVHPSQINRPGSNLGHRPRWVATTNTVDVDTGHNFKPLSLTTPSPYAKAGHTAQRSVSSITPGSSGSKLPMRNSLVRSSSEIPRVDDTPTRSGYSRLSFRERLASPGATSQQTLPKPRLSTQSSLSTLEPDRRSSLQASRSIVSSDEVRPVRPASSLASSSRRTSLLPQPKGRAGSETGRNSPQALAGARMAMRKNNSTIESKDGKPRWRH